MQFIGVSYNKQNFLIEGIKRSNNLKDCRPPITRHILEKLVKTTSLVYSSNFEAILFSTAFSVAYHAFLRVGVFTLSPNQTNQVIAFGHFKFVTNRNSTVDYIELIIPFSKTDQTGKRESVILEPTKNYVCPVLWLNKYIAMRPKIGGQLFVYLDGSPLTVF